MNKDIIPSGARLEIKYTAPELEYHRLLHWVQHHSHGFFAHYPDRIINNIYFAAAAASYSRAVVAGGYSVNVIQYFATGTPGNAVDFGDLSGSRYALGACTNGAGYGADRAVFGGGYDGDAAVNTIEYVAVSTLGNATDFGDLTVARRYPAGCSGD